MQTRCYKNGQRQIVNIAEHHYIHGLENGMPNIVIVAEATSARKCHSQYFI